MSFEEIKDIHKKNIIEWVTNERNIAEYVIDLSGNDFAEYGRQRILELSGVNLSGIDFSNIDLYRVNFTGANLSNCIFSNADLTETKFIGSNLSNANFDGAKLTDTKFSRANLSGAVFTNTTFTIEAHIDEYDIPIYTHIARFSGYYNNTNVNNVNNEILKKRINMSELSRLKRKRKVIS
jgi:uncharacterized protein YjbI with pentapeptide repeats